MRIISIAKKIPSFFTVPFGRISRLIRISGVNITRVFIDRRYLVVEILWSVKRSTSLLTSKRGVTKVLNFRGGEGIRTLINSLPPRFLCRRTHNRSATPPSSDLDTMEFMNYLSKIDKTLQESDCHYYLCL
jgi:hypothetical protein